MTMRWSLLFLLSLSVLLALLLDIYPLPLEYRLLRPQFTLLVVVYWLLVLPQSASMLGLLALSLVQDMLLAAPLGQHALMLLPVAWLCLRSYRRVRHFSRWQEVFWVGLLMVIALLMSYWVQSLSGIEFSSAHLFLPALASAIFWPFIVLVLDRLRRRYRISREV